MDGVLAIQDGQNPRVIDSYLNNEGEPWLNALNQYVRANHEYVKAVLEQAFPELCYIVPDSTYLAWLDLSPLNLDMSQLNQALIEHFDVAIMSGEVYGETGKGYLRLNLGCPRSKIEQGLTALIKAIGLQRSAINLGGE